MGNRIEGANDVRVYVAGSARNRDRARAFFDRVRALDGAEIAIDWIDDVDASEAKGVRDRDLLPFERVEYALKDLEGVASCDVLVVLAEAEPSGRGLWVELGYALALRDERGGGGWSAVRPHPHVIVSGGDRRSIFTAEGLVDCEFAYDVGGHDDKAFGALEEFVRACRGFVVGGVVEGDEDDGDVRAACEFCEAPNQSPAVGVRCGKCGARRVTDAEPDFEPDDFGDGAATRRAALDHKGRP